MTMWLKILGMAILIAFASGAKKCLFGSDKKGNCICPAGEEGRGDLCCYNPKKEQSCFVIQDPMLTSFSKFKMPLFFTCASRLAHLKISNKVIVELFIGNDERPSGAFFPAKISLAIKAPTSRYDIVFNFEGKKPSLNSIENLSPPSYKTHQLKDNELFWNHAYDVKIVYKKSANMYLVTFKSVKIYVRHPTKSKHNPGVCIVKKKSVKTFAKSKGDGCFVEGKPSLWKSMGYLTDLPSDSLEAFIPGKNKKVCNIYQEAKKDIPKKKDKLAKQKCGVIFYTEKIRKCFYNSGPGKNNVMKAYVKCYKTFVSGKDKRCTGLKKDDLFLQCASSLLDCEKWPYYKKKSAEREETVLEPRHGRKPSSGLKQQQ